MAVITEPRELTYRYAYTAAGLTEYIGVAEAGASEGDAVWKITKFVYSGTNVSQQIWCDGDIQFDNTWTGYTAHSYS